MVVLSLLAARSYLLLKHLKIPGSCRFVLVTEWFPECHEVFYPQSVDNSALGSSAWSSVGVIAMYQIRLCSFLSSVEWYVDAP